MIRIGQRLQEARQKKGLSIEEISKATKIKASFLSAIEKGDFNKLPSATYSKGFIVNYAEYLGFPKREALALFKREFDEEKAFQVLPKEFVEKKDLSKRRLGQNFFLLITVLFIFILYIIYQYRYAILPPPLNVDTPGDNQDLSSLSIIVSGKTDPNASVFVDEDIAFVDKEGNFKKEINFFPGKKIIKIKAVNRFGKETIIERKIKS